MATLKPNDEQINNGVQRMRDEIDKIILKRVKEFLKRKEAAKGDTPDSRDLSDKTWRDRAPLL